MIRYVLGQVLDRDYPRGTLLVNVAGSALLGLLVGVGIGTTAWAFLAVGFCGGLTTYSAFAVHTVDLGRRGPAYAAITLTASLVATAAGYALGALLGR